MFAGLSAGLWWELVCWESVEGLVVKTTRGMAARFWVNIGRQMRPWKEGERGELRV